MNATIDKDIDRAIGFLEADQIGEALACLRAMDAGARQAISNATLPDWFILSPSKIPQR
jgi:hypothetical protein